MAVPLVAVPLGAALEVAHLAALEVVPLEAVPALVAVPLALVVVRFPIDHYPRRYRRYRYRFPHPLEAENRHVAYQNGVVQPFALEQHEYAQPVSGKDDVSPCYFATVAGGLRDDAYLRSAFAAPVAPCFSKASARLLIAVVS